MSNSSFYFSTLSSIVQYLSQLSKGDIQELDGARQIQNVQVSESFDDVNKCSLPFKDTPKGYVDFTLKNSTDSITLGLKNNHQISNSFDDLNKCILLPKETPKFDVEFNLNNNTDSVALDLKNGNYKLSEHNITRRSLEPRKRSTSRRTRRRRITPARSRNTRRRKNSRSRLRSSNNSRRTRSRSSRSSSRRRRGSLVKSKVELLEIIPPQPDLPEET